MLNLPVPTPKDPRNRPRTGFSFSRLLIPSLAGYRGRGIYLDADMLVFGDIAEVWDLDMKGCPVHCSRQDTPPEQWKDNPHFQPGRQMSVMLLDCEKLRWDINEIVRDLDAGKYTYENLMFDMCLVPHDQIGEGVPQVWNSLETFIPGRTRLLHFTDMGQQPWKYMHNPNRAIWRAFYREAVQAEAVDPALVEAGIKAGHLHEDLRAELALPRLAATNDKSPEAASARFRAVQLEAMAARAEVDIARREFRKCDVERWELEKEVNRLKDEQAKLEARIEDIQRSFSFKMAHVATTPMRAAKKLLKRSA
jgi:lipopolysaccharide biosynthesis glycosyltransferase